MISHSLSTRAGLTLTLLGLLTLFPPQARVQAQTESKFELQRFQDRYGFPPPIPVYITGYSADAKAVLQNDLLFMGFKNGSEAEAKFIISGRNTADRVEARVVEKINQHQVLGKAYTGGNQRALIHALADVIAETITLKPGIAQTKIVFRTDLGPAHTEIYIADYDGYNARPVTQDKALTVAPCWMGKGGLMYSSYKTGNPKIYSHVLASGARHLLTPYAGSNISPAVSPDGKKVAMILSKAGSPDLYVANVDGSGLTRLTTTREDESSPCWSPDGRTILFVSRSRGPASLFTIPVTGGTMRRIATKGAANATEPDWSPDGKWIVFTTLSRVFKICIIPAAGGSIDVLAEGEDPSWAANSRAVIFCKGPDHAKKLSLLDVPTKEVKDIGRILMSNSQPCWAK
jgi:TolB protein